jgi:2-hydroxy-6-oxonona-2,4-dienedioate hydrolase
VLLVRRVDVHAPTLVVRGSRDPVIPQRWAEEATALLPRGRLAAIPSETHTIVVSAPEKPFQVAAPILGASSRRP